MSIKKLTEREMVLSPAMADALRAAEKTVPDNSPKMLRATFFVCLLLFLLAGAGLAVNVVAYGQRAVLIAELVGLKERVAALEAERISQLQRLPE